MRFLRVRLRDFRNYREALLAPGPGLNLLVGPNASGKTNLLEALAVLGAGRSPRLKGAEQLVRRGAEVATLEARTEDEEGGESRVHVGLEVGGKRRIQLDGKPTRRLSELLVRSPMVQLFPDDLRMPGGSPSLRRAYLDQLACQLVPGFLASRKAEERALRQRNAALKARRPTREVAALDAPFLDRAAEVLEGRARALGGLRCALGELPNLFSGEPVGCEYWALGRDREQLRGKLAERLRATAPEERRYLSTQVGPHRDDFRILVAGLPVQGNVSRGQLRSLMLRLKLAETEALSRGRGRCPVLLLDDALSDMDSRRRRATLEHLGGVGQVFLSVPELGPDQPGDPCRFEVSGGTLRPAPGGGSTGRK